MAVDRMRAVVEPGEGAIGEKRTDVGVDPARRAAARLEDSIPCGGGELGRAGSASTRTSRVTPGLPEVDVGRA
jgi:hypothetical protein